MLKCCDSFLHRVIDAAWSLDLATSQAQKFFQKREMKDFWKCLSGHFQVDHTQQFIAGFISQYCGLAAWCHQEPISWSAQLPYFLVTLFSQTSLFLGWISHEFRIPKKPCKPVTNFADYLSALHYESGAALINFFCPKCGAYLGGSAYWSKHSILLCSQLTPPD